jgi:magnesium-transporting ATPase (P-type)
MKKVFLFISLSLLILPVFVFAKTPAPDCNTYCSDPNTYDHPSGQVCICNPLKAPDFETLINNIINFIFYAALAIVPLVVVIGGFNILTSGGDPKKVETGKNIIIYALVGLIVVMLAKDIITVIRNVLGLK